MLYLFSSTSTSSGTIFISNLNISCNLKTLLWANYVPHSFETSHMYYYKTEIKTFKVFLRFFLNLYIIFIYKYIIYIIYTLIIAKNPKIIHLFIEVLRTCFFIYLLNFHNIKRVFLSRNFHFLHLLFFCHISIHDY